MIPLPLLNFTLDNTDIEVAIVIIVFICYNYTYI